MELCQSMVILKGSALDVVAAAHEAFNYNEWESSWTKRGGQGVANSIVNQKGYIRGSALEAITSAHDGFNTINGRPYGDKGGSEFSSSLSGTSDKANVAGKAVADKGKSGMDGVKGFEGVGKNHGEGYGTGISKASGFVKKYGDWFSVKRC